MPNLPAHLEVARVEQDPKNFGVYTQAFHKVLQRQWTNLIQVVNATLHVDTAANMPSTPVLDEILFYEQDTGRSYVAVSGNWIHLSPWSGRTVAVSTAYTMASTDAVVLGSASASVDITITVSPTAS